MRTRLVCFAAFAIVAAAVPVLISAQQKPAAPQPTGWILGEDADTKKNPLTADAATLAIGKGIYTDKCKRCHGPGGLGDGEDADPEARVDAEMNLTAAKRASRNPDGVVYYKVANGRKRPYKMPAFKDELNEQQLWAVVTYAQSLRNK